MDRSRMAGLGNWPGRSEQVLETGTERAGDEREWLIGRT